MNRREALSAVSLLIGGSVIGAEAFLSGCAKPIPRLVLFLNDDEIALLDEVGDTILPTTASSPGAKAARIGEFMDSIVADCYKEVEKKIFRDGLAKLEAASKSKYDNTGFMSLKQEEKHEFLVGLDSEAKNYKETRKPEDPEIHYYSMIKQLTLWGYFSSEIGLTKALRHVAVPGRYDACIPMAKGEKAWA